MPTPAELRNMLCYALIKGAKGLWIYEWGTGPKRNIPLSEGAPELWRTLLTYLPQFKQLTNVGPVQTKDGAVWAACEINQVPHTLWANPTNQPVQLNEHILPPNDGGLIHVNKH
jgi:hypothetical protein